MHTSEKRTCPWTLLEDYGFENGALVAKLRNVLRGLEERPSHRMNKGKRGSGRRGGGLGGWV